MDLSWFYFCWATLDRNERLESGLPCAADFPIATPPAPAQPRSQAVAPGLVPAAAEEAGEDETLFWDYGVPPAKAAAAVQPAAAPVQVGGQAC